MTDNKKKRVLVLGPKSYVGCSFISYVNQYYADKYIIDVLNMRDERWREHSFCYDVVLNCVGIAHIKETKQNKQQYYSINRDLVIEAAEKAKNEGVKQFIGMSSMAVYGQINGMITKESNECPLSAYGISKMEADTAIFSMESDSFRYACLRPPMIYGANCKGNYNRLRKVALHSPIFPNCNNNRSMLYIGNLCEFLVRIIDSGEGGIFFPQNNMYVNTTEMVMKIAKANGKHVYSTKIFNPIIDHLNNATIKKVFGTLVYEPIDQIDKYSFDDSIMLTENKLGVYDARSCEQR